MKDNAGEYLRRICIICLEDAILHPDMPLLVWLMCAQAKGYHMGVALASLCLKITYELACMPIQDCYPAATASAGPTVDAKGKVMPLDASVKCIGLWSDCHRRQVAAYVPQSVMSCLHLMSM